MLRAILLGVGGEDCHEGVVTSLLVSLLTSIHWILVKTLNQIFLHDAHTSIFLDGHLRYLALGVLKHLLILVSSLLDLVGSKKLDKTLYVFIKVSASLSGSKHFFEGFDV